MNNTIIYIERFFFDSQVCSKLREDWVKWIDSDPCPFASSDLEKFSSGQKIEFLGQLLEENPIRYSYLTKILLSDIQTLQI